MLFPKVKEPFLRFWMHAGLGGIGGIVLAILLSIVAGVVMLIIARISGEGFFSAYDMLELMSAAVPLGTLLGVILGAVYGIVRKGE